ncbi:MAG: hypothetical protein CME15_12190 [Gemmatimonadetes bacterium]|nr:hypothetical protein [Gemmatimonadota bacterium]
MTWLAGERGKVSLDRRWFALFVVAQACALGLAVALPTKIAYAVLAGIGGGLFLTFLLIYPWIIVPAVVATTAMDISGQLLKKTLIGIPVTGFHIALGLMVVSILANTFLRRRTTFPEFELKGPLFMLLGVMAFSLTYTPVLVEGTIGVVRTGCLILFLYGTQVMLDSRRAVNLVVISMSVALVAGSILAVVQIITERFYLPASFVIAVGANAPRATGTFHNPNTFGTFLMCGAVFLFAILVNHRLRLWQRVALLLPLLSAVTGLVTTFSRANWVAAMAGVVVALVVARKLRYLFYLAAISLVAILAVKEFVPFAEHIYERFASIFTMVEDFGAVGRESSSGRIYFVIAGLEMFLDHPLLGVGWRGFPVLFDAYKPIDFPYWVPTKESHTLFANQLAELGLLGFTASVWIVARVLRRGFTALPRMVDSYLRAVLIGLLSTFLAFQVSLSFTADFNNNFLWFFTGMLFAVIRLDEKLRSQDSP